ncbi:hypothetical protein SZN_35742, partial [Streptomyces zinciresistens K42]
AKPRKPRPPRATPSASAHGPAAARPSPSGEPSRAGSRAGEGRERPGREKPPLEEREAAARQRVDHDSDDTAVPDPAGDGQEAGETASAASPPPTAPPGRSARQPVTRAEPVIQLLPLGTGLVLIGLGLGLAFIGLRLRRG